MEADLLEEKTKKEEPTEYHKSWSTVCEADGIIVPGGFGSRGTEGMIMAAHYARTKNIPYLGMMVEITCWSVFWHVLVFMIILAPLRGVSGYAAGCGRVCSQCARLGRRPVHGVCPSHFPPCGGGDAGAQLWADGRHHEAGHEENHLHI